MAFQVHLKLSACWHDGGSQAFCWGSGIWGACAAPALSSGWGQEGGLVPRARERKRGKEGPGQGYQRRPLPPSRQEVQLGSWFGLVQILSSCQTLVPASESWPPWTLCPFCFSSSLALISVWEAGDVVKGTEGTEAWTGCMCQVLN